MFEAKVLEIARKIAPMGKAEFFNGSLFVVCNPKEATKIETLLIEKLSGECGVIVSSAGGAFAFDFV